MRELTIVAPRREIARGQSLGAGDDVRSHREDHVGGEHLPEAAEAGDHFVGDDQDVVGPADLRYALEVARGRNQHPAHAHDRLGIEAGDAIRAHPLHRFRELVHEAVAEGPRVIAAGAAIGIGRGDVVHSRPRHVEAHLDLVDAAERRGRGGAAVVGVAPADDLLLLRPAQGVEVALHEPQRRVVRGRPPAGVQHVIEVTGGETGELRAQLGGGAARSSPGTGSRRAGDAPAWRSPPRSRFARSRR